jgi:SH3-like domain-containing protein
MSHFRAMQGLGAPPKRALEDKSMTAARLAALFVFVLSAGAPVVGQAADKAPATPSGLPVPRYVSLKFDPVNARAGPGDDHRLLWVFHAKGLPVQVTAETDEWRRVCDPDGQLSWVHRRTTDGRRSVMRTQPGPATVRAQARPNAAVVAYLAPRALASLDRCQTGWCKIHVGRTAGWALASDLWGADDAPQCR